MAYFIFYIMSHRKKNKLSDFLEFNDEVKTQSVNEILTDFVNMDYISEKNMNIIDFFGKKYNVNIKHFENIYKKCIETNYKKKTKKSPDEPEMDDIDLISMGNIIRDIEKSANVLEFMKLLCEIVNIYKINLTVIATQQLKKNNYGSNFKKYSIFIREILKKYILLANDKFQDFYIVEEINLNEFITYSIIFCFCNLSLNYDDEDYNGIINIWNIVMKSIEKYKIIEQDKEKIHDLSFGIDLRPQLCINSIEYKKQTDVISKYYSYIYQDKQDNQDKLNQPNQQNIHNDKYNKIGKNTYIQSKWDLNGKISDEKKLLFCLFSICSLSNNYFCDFIYYRNYVKNDLLQLINDMDIIQNATINHVNISTPSFFIRKNKYDNTREIVPKIMTRNRSIPTKDNIFIGMPGNYYVEEEYYVVEVEKILCDSKYLAGAKFSNIVETKKNFIPCSVINVNYLTTNFADNVDIFNDIVYNNELYYIHDENGKNNGDDSVINFNSNFVDKYTKKDALFYYHCEIAKNITLNDVIKKEKMMKNKILFLFLLLLLANKYLISAYLGSVNDEKYNDILVKSNHNFTNDKIIKIINNRLKKITKKVVSKETKKSSFSKLRLYTSICNFLLFFMEGETSVEKFNYYHHIRLIVKNTTPMGNIDYEFFLYQIIINYVLVKPYMIDTVIYMKKVTKQISRY